MTKDHDATIVLLRTPLCHSTMAGKHDEGLRFLGHSRAGRRRLENRSRFQRSAELDGFVAESRIEQNVPADKVGCIRNFVLKDGGRIRESCWRCRTTKCPAPTRFSKARWR